MRKNPEDDFVCVTTASNQREAEMIESKLSSADVKAIIDQDRAMDITAILGSAPVEIPIFVRRKDFEKAEELLADHERKR